jgi:vancomycin resistance protein YoaR
MHLPDCLTRWLALARWTAAFLLCAAAAVFAEQPLPVLLSSCGTSVRHQTQETVRNIRLATGKISGMTLEPGQVFSFTSTVGQMTAADGYEQAPVLLDGRRNDIAGGGICQVASTLYSAALQAGLGILERHKHSSPVTYLPLGLDATIAWGQKDLRFQNTSGQSIAITGEIVGGRLIISLYGERPLEHTWEITSEINEIPPPETGKDLTPALEALVYRVELKDGEALSREFLYRDYFPSFTRGCSE